MKKALVVLLASLLVASCGQKAEKRIIGKWADSGTSRVVEFFEDGTFSMGEHGHGTWEVIDGPRLKLHEVKSDELVVLEGLEFSGDEMSWTIRGARETAVKVE